jgi:hypothetical protein
MGGRLISDEDDEETHSGFSIFFRMDFNTIPLPETRNTKISIKAVWYPVFGNLLQDFNNKAHFYPDLFLAHRTGGLIHS